MDLRDRLKAFAPVRSDRPAVLPRGDRASLDGHVSGAPRVTAFGECFRAESAFPSSHAHGAEPLTSVLGLPPAALALAGRDSGLESAGLRGAVFLDTETTGLAGGTGTVAFLVGLGRFDGGGFVVEQHFMRDYDEERAVLESVRERLDAASAVVSFNGKGFDLHLLATRFTLHRMPFRAAALPQLDLLFTARRLWKRRLGDCSLSNLEREILGFHRQDDVPGFLIPGLYFDFLRTGNAAAIAPVFRHNVWDILALAALAGRTGRAYADAPRGAHHPLDLLGLGRALEAEGQFRGAAACYREALRAGPSAALREEALTRLGFALKRSGETQAMVEAWETLLGQSPESLRVYEEIAKHLEHRMGDFGAALGWTERALARIETAQALRPGPEADLLSFRFMHRRERLKRKLAKGPDDKS